MFYGPKQSANAFLIQFNSAVPQQVLALPAEQERRFLPSEQEAWLMQFVAKDFLNLANFGQFGDGNGTSGYGHSVDGGSFHTNPISEASGAASNIGSQRAALMGDDRSAGSAEDSHWLKVCTIEQLGIAATTLYFTFTQDDDNGQRTRHSFAVVVTTPADIGHKVALRSICDRLTHMHARVTSIFFNEDGDDYYTSGGGTSAAANTSDQPPIGVGTLSGVGYDDDSYGHLNDTNNTGSNPPTGAGGPSGPAYPLSAIPDDLMQYEPYDETMGYNDIWRRELEAAVADVTLWVNGIVDRQKIQLNKTMIDELRRVSAQQHVARTQRQMEWLEQILCLALSEHRLIITGDKATVEGLLNTIALFMPDDRLFMASTQCFQNFIVPDLSFQGTTLPIAKIKTRLVWFRYPVAIVDVSKQALLDKSVHFLPARESGKKVYAVFREWRKDQIVCRRTLPLSKFMHSSLNPNRVVSPLALVIIRRFLNFIGFPTTPSAMGAQLHITAAAGGGGPQGSAGQLTARTTDGTSSSAATGANATMLRANGGNPASMATLPHPSQLSSQSYTTPLQNANTQQPQQLMSLSQLPPPMQQGVNNSMFVSVKGGIVGGLSSTSVNPAAAGGGGLAPQLQSATMGPTSAAAAYPNVGLVGRRPFLGEETGIVLEGPGAGYPRQFYDVLMFFLQQWRRTLTLRALAFYQSEVQMGREERDKPMALRTTDGDLHLLLATVEQIHPVGAAMEEKASQLLVSNFLF